MKKSICLVFIFLFCGTQAYSKYERILDAKFNPDTNITELNFATVTLYTFDIEAKCGDDVVDSLHRETEKLFIENGMAVQFLKRGENLPEQGEFVLEGSGNNDKTVLFGASENDLIVSGTLRKAERVAKGFGKSYVHLEIELYIFSKSKNAIVYKVNFDDMMRLKGGGYGSKMREALIAILNPLFEALKETNHVEPH